jgi:voltage-dependent potassium channel beta subunit
MEYRRLGKSGLQVSALSLGSWLTFGKQISDSTAEELMIMAYEAGVNFFDNAEGYAEGKSEVTMGKILKKLKWDRSSFIVSSKVFFGDGGRKPNQKGLSRKHIFEACDAAMKRLQVDYLDLYFCHRPDKSVPIEETVIAMNHLMMQGKIMYWGTSEWSAQEIMEAHMVAKEYRLVGPTMEQPQYNMFYRRKVEVEFNQVYNTVGLGTTIWSPLASGVLTGKYKSTDVIKDTRFEMKDLNWLKDELLTNEKIEKAIKLNTLAQDLGTSLPKLAIAWTLKNPNVSTAILGASNPIHLKETLQSLEAIPLINESVNGMIETILANKPNHPPF